MPPPAITTTEFPYFCNSVLQLSGPNDYLHLEDITFGHASLNQSLQHLLLVQPVMRWKQGCEQKQTRVHSAALTTVALLT